jgi:hypothetical protein
LLEEKIPQDLLREFVGWVKEYLAPEIYKKGN